MKTLWKDFEFRDNIESFLCLSSTLRMNSSFVFRGDHICGRFRDSRMDTWVAWVYSRATKRWDAMCIGDKKCEESKVIFCVDDGHNLFLSWPGFVGQRQKLRRNESATRKSHMWRRMFVGKTVGTRLFSWRIMLLYIFIYLYSHSIFQSQRPTRVKMLVRKIFTSHRFTPRIPSSCCPLHDRWSCPLHLAGELVEPIPCAYFPISSVSNPSQDPQFLCFFSNRQRKKNHQNL